jgi:hypothetical protein
MEPNTFKLYKISKKQNVIYLVLTITMLIIGLTGFVIPFVSDIEFFMGNTSMYIMFAFQGVIGIFIARNNIKAVKYFVSWDDNEISYQLPDNETLETIKIEDIKSIEKAPQEIKIKLNNNEIKHFKFVYFYFPKRTTILNYFELLKTQAENRTKLAY